MKKILCFLLIVTLVLSGFTVLADSEDVSWYIKTKKSFTLTTAAELLGLSKLSQDGETFEGKTILLGADITLNNGDMRVAGANPTVLWNGLINFAGTIDGQGYSIKGMYASGENTVGFISTADGCTVKNLNIIDSYFQTTNGNTVSAFIASGVSARTLTVEGCYTNAKIVSQAYNAGGFVSSVGNASETYATECWFDGEIVINVRYAAAIVANGEGKLVTVKDCLNTGTVFTNWTDSAMSHIASMIGRNDGRSVVIDCLNLGTVSTALAVQGKPDAFGSLFGRCSGQGGSATVTDSAALAGTGPVGQLCGTSAGELSVTGTPDYLSEDQLTGYNAVSNTSLDFENVWTAVPGEFPQLRRFANKVYPLLTAPGFVENQIRVEEDYGLRYLFRFDFPEGYTMDDVSVGSVVVPALAVDYPTDLVLGFEAEYDGVTFDAVDVPAENLWDEGDDFVEYTVVITAIDEDSAFINFYVRPYVTYYVDDLEITVYGDVACANLVSNAVDTYEAADADAKAEFDAIEVLKAVYEKFKDFNMREGWLMDGVWTGVTAFMGGTLGVEFTVGEDIYDLEAHAYKITDTTLDMFKQYVADLMKVGFILHADNGENGIDSQCWAATLYNNAVTVNVAYYKNTGETFVTSERKRALSDYQLQQNFTKIAGKGVVLDMLPLFAFGESMVFSLPNGHFVIVDGAQPHNSEYTVNFLVEHAPAGTKPVVDGWFFTHAHPDHMYCAMGIGSNPDLVSKIRVEGFYYTWPNENGVRTESDYAGITTQMANLNAALPNFRTASGEVTPLFKIHAGQRYYFSEFEVQVLQTQDQLFPNEYRGGFNDSSTSYKFITSGQTLLIMGDAHYPVCNRLMEHYSKETLHCTFFQSLHHGGN
ncbi:MAG: hypothetical protein IJV00_07020, partial [Clostridia bacterium]|nr:hypothetical protein [Clostridia bacterium]